MRNVISRISSIVKDRGGLAKTLKTALIRPGAVTRALARVAVGDWRKMAGRSKKEAARLQAELKQSDLVSTLNQRLRDEFAGIRGAEVRGRAAVPGGMRPLHAEMLWLLVRSRQPKKIVETGVCNGLSSAVLLEAIDKNGAGHLISVDLPEFTDPGLNRFDVWEGKGGAAIPAGRDAGWLVRQELRPSWRLELGRSQDLLPLLLTELAPIDLFIHDSEHSYDNQLFEFREGFQALRSGGILVATDITWSDAFDHFWDEVRATGAKRVFVDPSCAMVEKA